MKQYLIRYWSGGATIRYKVYKAQSAEAAILKFHRYRIGEVLGVEEIEEDEDA